MEAYLQDDECLDSLGPVRVVDEVAVVFSGLRKGPRDGGAELAAADHSAMKKQ